MADKTLDKLNEFDRVVKNAAQEVCDVVTKVCRTIDSSNGHLRKALQPELYERQKLSRH